MAPGARLDFGLRDRGARGQSRTVDGRIQKKPDLTFRPPLYRAVTNATRWGWFVECKILDGQRSVRAYADHGIQRFALGEYAAWMQSGAMLGYVRMVGAARHLAVRGCALGERAPSWPK